MTYQAPYAVRYVTEAGEQLQLLDLWDDTPNPPGLSGSLESHETSLVDSAFSYAQGLRSAVEQREIAFYRWFVDYRDMAFYQEEIALWLTSNQNGKLTLSFEDETKWQFDAVITGYSFSTENFIPPPNPEQGNLCLLITLTTTLTNRSSETSGYVFNVSPEAFDVPVEGGEFIVAVESYSKFSWNQEDPAINWTVEADDGLVVSDIAEGINGSFNVAVAANEGDEDRTMTLRVIQDRSGQTVEIKFRQLAYSYVFSVSPTEIEAPAEGEIYQIQCVSYRDPGEVSVDWSAKSSYSNLMDGVYITDVINGNNGSFNINVAPNGEWRTVTVDVTQEETGIVIPITINQGVKKDYILSVSPSSLTMPASGGDYTFIVYSYYMFWNINKEYLLEWTVTEDAIMDDEKIITSVKPGGTSISPGEVSISLPRNGNVSEDTYNLYFTQEESGEKITVTITQLYE